MQKIQFEGARLFFGGVKWAGCLVCLVGFLSAFPGLAGPVRGMVGLNIFALGIGMIAVGLIGQLVAISASNISEIRKIAEAYKAPSAAPPKPVIPQLWR